MWTHSKRDKVAMVYFGSMFTVRCAARNAGCWRQKLKEGRKGTCGVKSRRDPVEDRARQADRLRD